MCENTKDKFESRWGSVVTVDTDTAGALGERKRRTETTVSHRWIVMMMMMMMTFIQ
jgi:hypothetical protein